MSDPARMPRRSPAGRAATGGAAGTPAISGEAPSSSQPPAERPSSAGADGAAAPLDVLLVDGTLGSLRRWLPGRAEMRFVTSLVRRPAPVVRHGSRLAGELTRVVRGTCELEPPARDRRFADPAWRGNPALRRLMQAYLAAGSAVEGVVGETTDAGLDWRTSQRVRFVADNLVQAVAPSNVPVLNPAALKAAVDTGGANYVRGAANLLRDLARPPRVPAMVDTDAFEVGEDLAVSPGAVILRTPVFELIQYAASTRRVRRVPLLFVPPTINKYYVTDLAPGRSMVEYFVNSGQQVFMISWRNPDARHAAWGIDTYVQAVLDALTAVERVSGAERSVLLGLCSGGIISSLALGHLAATGAQDRVAGLTLGVAVLDQAQGGTAGALLDRRVAQAAAAASARRGYLDGRALAEVFAWLRPGDLVWNYWVNNYLLGKQPPAFDVLYWNADTTRMTAGLHRDFLDLAVENALVIPGKARALGTPVDLSKVQVDSYVVAGISDHLCPWESCYRTTQLLGGSSRFVLSTSGHIAALVNPPGNPKASYQVHDIADGASPPAPANPADPQEWLGGAVTRKGSWWDDYVSWLEERCGPDGPAPTSLGGGAGSGLEPLDEAPGRYVYDR